MSITVDYESNWYERILGRIYTQFRDTVTWPLWARLIARQAQDLEDALQSLFNVYDIDNVGGVQLDVIGTIIGQPRLGVDDATYRLYLKTRIMANRSTGTPEDLYKVMRAFFARLAAFTFLEVHTSNIGVKAFTLRVSAVISRAEAMIATYFLGVAKEAGARGILEWREQTGSTTFTYDGTTAQAYDNGKYAGAKQA
jgi:hypothetical protein